MQESSQLTANAKAWPFQEARRLIDRLGGAHRVPAKGYVLLETGYGPSGLPHIGTFGEVARTTMVRHAFASMSDAPTKLFAFSDDMDGLRKVPENIPNREQMAQHLGKPLTAVPDPFGEYESFGAHNNQRLRTFLDQHGFDYEFLSSTDCYRSGRFDATLRKVLERFDEVINVILPTLGKERRATYSPFLPVCPRTGVVLQVPVRERRVADGTIVYDDPETGNAVEVPVTGGHCKLQWKADWAMRWVALDVDYEMAGKDLIDSVSLSGRICRILGSTPPAGFNYELFLDENGEKISKSRGNGLAFEDWMRYGPPESLALFNFQKPKTAKRLYFDVIPKAVDEYLSFSARYPDQSPAEQIENPAWHIHGGAPPAHRSPVSYALLLNLAAAAGTNDKTVLWGFISRYAPDASPQTAPFLDHLIEHALAYYHDFVEPTKSYRPPDARERQAMEALIAALRKLPADADAETIQNEVYAVGKSFPFDNLRDWFRALYEILFGQSQGPRFGSFVALYGIPETIAMMRRVLETQPAPA